MNTTATEQTQATKSVKAIQIRARIEGESWMSRGGTFAATTEQEGIDKAKQVLGLKDKRYVIEAKSVTVHQSDLKLKSDDYPYGRLRCTAFFSVEYNDKGARTIFQTINPKNGRLNAEKKSTYYKVILPMVDDSTGHIEFCGHNDFNGSDEINRGVQFMADFHELFTEKQVKDIAITLIAMYKVHTYALVQYKGADFEAIKPLMENQVKTAVEIANTGKNLWFDCSLDLDALDATKNQDPNFSPFKATVHTTL